MNPMKIIKKAIIIISLPALCLTMPIFLYFFMRKHDKWEIIYMTESEVRDSMLRFVGGSIWKFRILSFLLSLVIYYVLYIIYVGK